MTHHYLAGYMTKIADLGTSRYGTFDKKAAGWFKNWGFGDPGFSTDKQKPVTPTTMRDRMDELPHDQLIKFIKDPMGYNLPAIEQRKVLRRADEVKAEKVRKGEEKDRQTFGPRLDPGLSEADKKAKIIELKAQDVAAAEAQTIVDRKELAKAKALDKVRSERATRGGLVGGAIGAGLGGGGSLAYDHIREQDLDYKRALILSVLGGAAGAGIGAARSYKV
jgi:hypothetical protein